MYRFHARDLNLGTDINNRNRYGVRGQLLFQPNSDLKIRLIADFDNIGVRPVVNVNINTKVSSEMNDNGVYAIIY